MRHDSARTQTHRLLLGQWSRRDAKCWWLHLPPPQAGQQESSKGGIAKEHGGERWEQGVTTKSETRRGSYLYVFMYKTGLTRGLERKKFQGRIRKKGIQNRDWISKRYLGSWQSKCVYMCVRVCVFVAGTELSHLCVIMANQHVDWGHRGNGPVKRANDGSVPSLCGGERRGRGLHHIL